MEHKIKDISIERIRQHFPHAKGLGNDLLIEHTEHYLREGIDPFFRHPLRLEGLFIGLRKKGKSCLNINLKSHEWDVNNLIICTSGDLIHGGTASAGLHLSQVMMVSSNFLKEMYINLNTFIPFFASQKEHPVLRLTEEEVKEMDTYFMLIEEAVECEEDYFRSDIVKRLLAAYLYKLGSVLYRHRPGLQEEASRPLKREEVLFKQFISLVSEHHRKERRVDFYAGQLFLTPKHFSTVIKKVSGKTAGQWIDEYVILEIKTLLKYSTMSIQEVAYYMNFPNPSFFGKYFRHHTGMSPSEYKAQI